MRVLVTGATGFVGREILRQLHQQGQSIRHSCPEPSLRRGRSEAVSSWEPRFIPATCWQAASLDGAMEGTEAVIHLVGIISEVGESTFENVHTRGTRNHGRRGAAGQESGDLSR